MKGWVIRAGRNDHMKPLALEEGVAIIGWQSAGELKMADSRGVLKARLAKSYPDKATSVPMWTGQIWRFLHEIEEGDLVCMPLLNSDLVHIGRRSTGAYVYRSDFPEGRRQTIPVEWKAECRRADLSSGTLDQINRQGTVIAITRYSAMVELSRFVGLELPTQAQDVSFIRNPPWSRDELILALHLYMQNPKSPPGKKSAAVKELSATLNRLALHSLGARAADYRNAAGVYMKMMNFRRFDPEVISAGKVGLSRGNKDDQLVWDTFVTDPVRLASTAAAIIGALNANAVGPETNTIDDDDFQEAAEGRILTRLHLSRERNRKLVARRKAHALKQTGKLECEGCGFNFHQTYGQRGEGFIVAHHTKALHTLQEGDRTRLEDLALVCANCHAMIHARRPWLDLAELRSLLRPRPGPPA